MMTVFLSSTFRDFGDYRNEVSEALNDESVGVVQLENSAGPYQDAVELCRQTLDKSNGFMLLLAHWYGSIPPELSKSITHLEFEWAWERWKQKKPCPMAVLMPRPGSQADLELKVISDSLLLGAPEDYRKKHPDLLGCFRDEVSGRWRTVCFFGTRARAAQKALVAWSKWTYTTPVVEGQGDDVLRPESLGSLGRTDQSNAFKRAASLLKGSAAPGAAFLVAGEESAGQVEFLSHLAGGLAISGRPASVAFLPAAGFAAEKLPSWAGDQLGFSDTDRTETIADLAAKLAGELQKQSLTLVLGNLEYLAGGVVAFHEKFWKPLFDELSGLRQKRSFRHRLIAVVAEYEPPQDGWQASFYPFTGNSPSAYDRLLLLPELKEIAADDLMVWLVENEIAAERRAALVTAVMKSAAAVPAGIVFERLRRQNLTREEGDDI